MQRRPTDTAEQRRDHCGEFPHSDGPHLVTEFDLFEPSGRLHRFRIRSRREQLREVAEIAALMAISLLLLMLQAAPLILRLT